VRVSIFHLFMRLKHERPKFYHKISAVAGDASLPGLGLSPKDRQTLADEVNIVFHAAATIRFDEHIRTAININVLGTREIIKLAKEMNNLKVLNLIHSCTKSLLKTFRENEVIRRKIKFTLIVNRYCSMFLSQPRKYILGSPLGYCNLGIKP